MTVSAGYETLERGLTDWTFEADARTYLSPVADERSTESVDRRWCCTCAQSCRPEKSDQECEVREKDEIVPMPLKRYTLAMAQIARKTEGLH